MNWYRIASGSYFDIGHKGYHSGELNKCTEHVWIWNGTIESVEVNDDNMMSNHGVLFGDKPHAFKGRAEVCPDGTGYVSWVHANKAESFIDIPKRLEGQLRNLWGDSITIKGY